MVEERLWTPDGSDPDRCTFCVDYDTDCLCKRLEQTGAIVDPDVVKRFDDGVDALKARYAAILEQRGQR